MTTSGARLTQLTDGPNEAARPSYSPDGRFIAFVGDGDPVPGLGGTRYPDIFRMRADGTRPINLTRTPSTFEFEPDWQAG
jgi:Tol biopolymer transport system component